MKSILKNIFSIWTQSLQAQLADAQQAQQAQKALGLNSLFSTNFSLKIRIF